MSDNPTHESPQSGPPPRPGEGDSEGGHDGGVGVETGGRPCRACGKPNDRYLNTAGKLCSKCRARKMAPAAARNLDAAEPDGRQRERLHGPWLDVEPEHEDEVAAKLSWCQQNAAPSCDRCRGHGVAADGYACACVPELDSAREHPCDSVRGIRFAEPATAPCSCDGGYLLHPSQVGDEQAVRCPRCGQDPETLAERGAAVAKAQLERASHAQLVATPDSICVTDLTWDVPGCGDEPYEGGGR